MAAMASIWANIEEAVFRVVSFMALPLMREFPGPRFGIAGSEQESSLSAKDSMTPNVYAEHPKTVFVRICPRAANTIQASSTINAAGICRETQNNYSALPRNQFCTTTTTKA
ncbi:MAG: hypothetical protein JSS22_17785 [Proteobacteria bacterium]|nr:hypothetical protein [Pseudomonadota bacterium]